MNQPTAEVSVECLTQYEAADAVAIGRLMPHLSDRFTDEPISESLLREIIDSPFHDQVVARDEQGRIVGTATMTTTMGAAVGRNAWLEDLVVDPDTRGMGVGGKLWDYMISWCENHGVRKLGFTSRSDRVAAHDFYLKRGAEIRDTNYFKKNIT